MHKYYMRAKRSLAKNSDTSDSAYEPAPINLESFSAKKIVKDKQEPETKLEFLDNAYSHQETSQVTSNNDW